MRRISILLVALAMTFIASAAERCEQQTPLYIVNGRVMTVEEVQEVPTTDIESLTVLRNDKDVAEFQRFGDTSNGVVVITLKDREEEDMPFIHVDVMPKFMGGDINTFRNWVMQNLRYPEVALNMQLQDMVVVQFVVNREGYIVQDGIKVLQSNHPDIFVDEIKRIFATSPRWTPGIQTGTAVSVSFVLPVNFVLPEQNEDVNNDVEEFIDDNGVVVDKIYVSNFTMGSFGDKEPLWIVDGKPATIEQVRELGKSGTILFMHLLKEGMGYYEDFGDTKNGVVLIRTKSDDMRVVEHPDVLPKFLGGGFETFERWVSDNIRYPEELAKQGLEAHILVDYIITSAGYIEVSKITYMKGTEHTLFDDAIRAVMLKAPIWTPATKDGEDVAYAASMPIIFGSFQTPKQ
ncbi:MAG: energy transducer TonB [Alistipes sp.]|nr:energy transducer TonB [Alistipes sp.]